MGSCPTLDANCWLVYQMLSVDMSWEEESNLGELLGSLLQLLVLWSQCGGAGFYTAVGQWGAKVSAIE